MFPILTGLTLVSTFLLLLIAIEQHMEKTLLDRKRAGIAHLRRTTELMISLQQHRGMANSCLNGDATFRTRLPTVQTNIEQQLQAIVPLAVGNVDAHARQLSRWHVIHDSWQELKRGLFDLSPAESFAAHTRIIREVLYLMEEAADCSGIVFDPDPSNQLMAAILVRRLPELIEQIGQGRGLGAGVIAAGKCPPVSRIKLAFLAHRIDFLLNETEAALRELPSPAGRKLQAGLKDCRDSTRQFVNLLNGRVIQPAHIDLKLKPYFAEATRAIEANIALIDQLADTLHSLFAVQIGDLARPNRYAPLLPAAISTAFVLVPLTWLLP
ncbi:nitrate- and nitrite sensing domain-containing protein [Methylocaldum sp.]|uniref:nitrate- and nitrite sensing domain-containing protein n=1 Tax=Methylocaldum sp. TaxID=1969727 RepID=UPI002D342CC7|nr:nitrate- and nitrite sensing domain-containing protein [Methylocaldum sp.]HYE37421.1 nitrate- and nitrite sensing domain-containing protein [Methylocaldum sp.]